MCKQFKLEHARKHAAYIYRVLYHACSRMHIYTYMHTYDTCMHIIHMYIYNRLYHIYTYARMLIACRHANTRMLCIYILHVRMQTLRVLPGHAHARARDHNSSMNMQHIYVHSFMCCTTHACSSKLETYMWGIYRG